MLRISKLTLISLACFLLISKTCFAIIPVTDWLAELREAEMLERQATQIKQQLEQIQYMVKNSNAFTSLNWDNARQNLMQLASTMQQANALAYTSANIDQQFRQKFPGYADQSTTTDYSSEYQKWVKTNQSTMNAVMDQVNTSYEQESQEEAMDQLFSQKANSAQGRMQALQVGNEIGAEEVAQIQKLKAMMMAQTNAQAEYYTYQSQKDAATQQSVNEVVKNANDQYPPYKEDSDFSTIPSFGNGE